MKQLTFVFAATLMAAAVPAGAAVYADNYGAQPAVTVVNDGVPARKVDAEYVISNNVNMYYQGGGNNGSRAGLYRDYDGCNYNGCVPAKVAAAPVKQAEPVRQAAVKKQSAPAVYHKLYLADPFFQPAAGHMGAAITGEYHINLYDFAITNTSVGGWRTGSLGIAGDLSYGITDNLSVVGGLRYTFDNYRMHVRGSSDPTAVAGYARNKWDGFNPWALGLQYKFIDDETVIGYIGAHYRGNDMTDQILADFKIGKRFDRTTIYALARASYLDWKNDSYGDSVVRDDGAVSYIVFEKNVDTTFPWELGAGVFHVMAPDWTIGGEVIFGDYSWHQQAYGKLTLHYQPTESFAFGIFGSMSFYDSANSSKDIEAYSMPAGSTSFGLVGDVNIDNFRDIAFGAQALLYF